MLHAEPERLAARGDDLHAGAVLEQLDETRAGRCDLLDVVEDEQNATLTQLVLDPRQR